eukprot:g17663.t1
MKVAKANAAKSSADQPGQLHRQEPAFQRPQTAGLLASNSAGDGEPRTGAANEDGDEGFSVPFVFELDDESPLLPPWVCDEFSDAEVAAVEAFCRGDRPAYVQERRLFQKVGNFYSSALDEEMVRRIADSEEVVVRHEVDATDCGAKLSQQRQADGEATADGAGRSSTSDDADQNKNNAGAGSGKPAASRSAHIVTELVEALVLGEGTAKKVSDSKRVRKQADKKKLGAKAGGGVGGSADAVVPGEAGTVGVEDDADTGPGGVADMQSRSLSAEQASLSLSQSQNSTRALSPKLAAKIEAALEETRKKMSKKFSQGVDRKNKFVSAVTSIYWTELSMEEEEPPDKQNASAPAPRGNYADPPGRQSGKIQTADLHENAGSTPIGCDVAASALVTQQQGRNATRDLRQALNELKDAAATAPADEPTATSTGADRLFRNHTDMELLPGGGGVAAAGCSDSIDQKKHAVRDKFDTALDIAAKQLRIEVAADHGRNESSTGRAADIATTGATSGAAGAAASWGRGRPAMELKRRWKKWERTHDLGRLGAKAVAPSKLIAKSESDLKDAGDEDVGEDEKDENESSGDSDSDAERSAGGKKQRVAAFDSDEILGAAEEVDMVKTGCVTIAILKRALAAAEASETTTRIAFVIVVDKGGLPGAYVVAVWMLRQVRRLKRLGSRLKIVLTVKWCRQHAMATCSKEAVAVAASHSGNFSSIEKVEDKLRSWIACHRQRTIFQKTPALESMSLVQLPFEKEDQALAAETHDFHQFYGTAWKSDLFRKYKTPGRPPPSAQKDSVATVGKENSAPKQKTKQTFSSDKMQDPALAGGRTTMDLLGKTNVGEIVKPTYVARTAHERASGKKLPPSSFIVEAGDSQILNELALAELRNGVEKLGTARSWELPAFTRWLRVIMSFSTVLSQSWLGTKDLEIGVLHHMGRGERSSFTEFDRASLVFIAVVGFLVILPSAIAEKVALSATADAKSSVLFRHLFRKQVLRGYDDGFEQAALRLSCLPRDYELAAHATDRLGGAAFRADDVGEAADELRDTTAHGLLASRSAFRHRICCANECLTVLTADYFDVESGSISTSTNINEDDVAPQLFDAFGTPTTPQTERQRDIVRRVMCSDESSLRHVLSRAPDYESITGNQLLKEILEAEKKAKDRRENKLHAASRAGSGEQADGIDEDEAYVNGPAASNAFVSALLEYDGSLELDFDHDLAQGRKAGGGGQPQQGSNGKPLAGSSSSAGGGNQHQVRQPFVSEALDNEQKKLLERDVFFEQTGLAPSRDEGQGFWQYVSCEDSRASMLSMEITRLQLLDCATEAEQHSYMTFLHEVEQLMDLHTVAVERFHRFPKAVHKATRSGQWRTAELVSASAQACALAWKIQNARKALRKWLRRETLRQNVMKKGATRRNRGLNELCRICKCSGSFFGVGTLWKTLDDGTRRRLREMDVTRRYHRRAQTRQRVLLDIEQHYKQFPSAAEAVLDDARRIGVRVLEMQRTFAHVTRDQVATLSRANTECCGRFQLSSYMCGDFKSAMAFGFMQPRATILAQAVGLAKTAAVTIRSKIKKAMKKQQEPAAAAAKSGQASGSSNKKAGTSAATESNEKSEAAASSKILKSLKLTPAELAMIDPQRLLLVVGKKRLADRNSADPASASVQRATQTRVFCAPWCLLNPDRSHLFELTHLAKGPARILHRVGHEDSTPQSFFAEANGGGQEQDGGLVASSGDRVIFAADPPEPTAASGLDAGDESIASATGAVSGPATEAVLEQSGLKITKCAFATRLVASLPFGAPCVLNQATPVWVDAAELDQYQPDELDFYLARMRVFYPAAGPSLTSSSNATFTSEPCLGATRGDSSQLYFSRPVDDATLQSLRRAGGSTFAEPFGARSPDCGASSSALPLAMEGGEEVVTGRHSSGVFYNVPYLIFDQLTTPKRPPPAKWPKKPKSEDKRKTEVREMFEGVFYSVYNRRRNQQLVAKLHASWCEDARNSDGSALKTDAEAGLAGDDDEFFEDDGNDRSEDSSDEDEEFSLDQDEEESASAQSTFLRSGVKAFLVSDGMSDAAAEEVVSADASLVSVRAALSFDEAASASQNEDGAALLDVAPSDGLRDVASENNKISQEVQPPHAVALPEAASSSSSGSASGSDAVFAATPGGDRSVGSSRDRKMQQQKQSSSSSLLQQHNPPAETKKQPAPDVMTPETRRRYEHEKAALAQFLKKRISAASFLEHLCWPVLDDVWGENKRKLIFGEVGAVATRLKTGPLPGCREAVQLQKMIADHDPPAGQSGLLGHADRRGRVHNPMAEFLGIERVRRVATRKVVPGKELGAKLHLYTLTSRLRFVMLHYRAPKSSLPALSDERRDIDAIQTRFGLWMAETKRKALQYLPEDDVENRTSIEKLAAPLDRERIRDFMSRTRTFELMTPTEAQDFVSLHTVGGKRSGSRAVLSDSDDDDDDEEVLDVGPDDYEEALGDALGGRGSKGVAAVRKAKKGQTLS